MRLAFADLEPNRAERSIWKAATNGQYQSTECSSALIIPITARRDCPVSTPEADNLVLFSLYEERCAAAGKDLPAAEMPYFRFVYLDEDEHAAREYPRESLRWVRDLGGYRRTLTHGDGINVDLDYWRLTRTVEPTSYELELETTAYFGTPEQCVQRITRLRDEHGIGYVGASMSFGHMERTRVMCSMELFATEATPPFQTAGAICQVKNGLQLGRRDGLTRRARAADALASALHPPTACPRMGADRLARIPERAGR